MALVPGKRKLMATPLVRPAIYRYRRSKMFPVFAELKPPIGCKVHQTNNPRQCDDRIDLQEGQERSADPKARFMSPALRLKAVPVNMVIAVTGIPVGVRQVE